MVDAGTAQPQDQFRHNTIAPIPENGGDNEEGEEADERTSLLPKPIQKARHTLSAKIRHLFSYLPRPVRRRIDALDSPFLDTAILCTATGMLLGLVPKLHRAFFSSYEEGGIFNAWLVSSIENVGTLFTSLQVFLVGCKLGVSFERMKRSPSPSSPDEGLEEDAGGSGRVPIRAIVVVYTVRLILWPMYIPYPSPPPPLLMQCLRLTSRKNKHPNNIPDNPLHTDNPTRPSAVVYVDGDSNWSTGTTHLRTGGVE
jgi:auxin efflux carrier family protein